MILLDTHVLLWWILEEKRLSLRQRRAISRAGPESPLLLSDISLWEVAMLYALGRFRLDRPLRQWLEQATAPPLVRTCPISPAIAAEVAALPDSFSRDPADRIIVSTARVHGAQLMTRDERILAAGVVPTLV